MTWDAMETLSRGGVGLGQARRRVARAAQNQGILVLSIRFMTKRLDQFPFNDISCNT